jgi:hypothetical protein
MKINFSEEWHQKWDHLEENSGVEVGLPTFLDKTQLIEGVTNMDHKFEAGDVVRCIKDKPRGAGVKIGNIYTVRESYISWYQQKECIKLEGIDFGYLVDQFELLLST